MSGREHAAIIAGQVGAVALFGWLFHMADRHVTWHQYWTVALALLFLGIAVGTAVAMVCETFAAIHARDGFDKPTETLIDGTVASDSRFLICSECLWDNAMNLPHRMMHDRTSK